MGVGVLKDVILEEGVVARVGEELLLSIRRVDVLCK